MKANSFPSQTEYAAAFEAAGATPAYAREAAQWFAKYESETCEPLAHSHADYLLDNFAAELNHAGARLLADAYKAFPHVARAIAADERRARVWLNRETRN